MFTVVLGNIVTIVIIVVSLYFVYKKNSEKVDAIKEELASKASEIECAINDMHSAVEKINTLLDSINSSITSLSKKEEE